MTLTGSVAPAQAIGKVTFYDGTIVLGTAALTNGSAKISAILPVPGDRSLKAYFSGGAGYAPSSSVALSQTVKVVAATIFTPPISHSTAGPSNPYIAVADFNGDGHLDIVTNAYTVLMGNGDGTFRAPMTYITDKDANDVATGDFNGDGKPDFATASLNGVGIWLNKGDGTFQPPVFYSASGEPVSIAVADFNNDGIADIAVASRTGQLDGVGVLLGVGDGTFKPVVRYLTGELDAALAVADFNGDGNADIVVVFSGDDRPVTILLGAGDGTFHSTGAYYSAIFPTAVAIGDFNKDGRPDFVVANYGVSYLSVFLGNGDGTFVEHPEHLLRPALGAGGFNSGLVVGDFDGDGNLDIAYAGSGGPIISVFQGKGDGTFRGAVNFAAGANPHFLVASEFNGDGRTDLAVTDAASVQIMLAGTGAFPSVTTTSLPDAMGGVTYSSTLAATGGMTPYNWSISAGSLPIALSPTGTISGTPPANTFTATDSFTVMVSGPNGAGFTSSENLSIKVAAAFAINTLSTIIVGEVGSPYSAALEATGGTPPYHNWMVTAGSLPPGLMLDPTSGLCSGTPTAPGSFLFTVTVSDSAGLTSLPAKISILVTASAAPQPTRIANAASGGQATAFVVATGSYVSIYGTGLASTGNPSATSLPLSALLNGTQVTLGGLPMPLLYAASDQVNGLVPQALAPNNSYPLVVTNGARSVPLMVVVKELQPGIYTVDASGSGPGIVANALTGQLISASNPAHVHDYLSVYCTGLGPLQGPHGQMEPVEGSAAPTSIIFQTIAKVTATIGGLSAPVLFSGLTPAFAGLYQVNVQVPVGVAAASAVPLVITATDLQTGATAQSNIVTIVVQ